MATARQDSLVGLRGQLVSHGIELRAHVGHDGLAGLRVGWVWIVLRHSVLRRREGRAHGLGLVLVLVLGLRLRLLGVLQTDWRQIEGRQRHV